MIFLTPKPNQISLPSTYKTPFFFNFFFYKIWAFLEKGCVGDWIKNEKKAF